MKNKSNIVIGVLTLLLAVSVVFNFAHFQGPSEEVENAEETEKEMVKQKSAANDFKAIPAGFQANYNMTSSNQVIDWATADAMAVAYQQHPGVLMTNGMVLEGFRVEKSTVDSIFAQQNIEALYLMMGISPTTLDLAPPDQEFTVAVMGIESNGTSSGEISSDALIYDFMDPCPARCPEKKN